MKKQILAFILCAEMLCVLGYSAVAASDAFAIEAEINTAAEISVEAPAEEVTAKPEETAEPELEKEESWIYLNSSPLYDAEAEVYYGDTYVSAAALIKAVYPDAVVSWENNQMVASAEGLTLTAAPSMNYFVANGRYIYTENGMFMKNDSIMLPIRPLAKAIGLAVEWDGKNSHVFLTSGSGPILSGDQFYNSDDLYWLSRIISAESRGEPFEGQLAVGNVVLNRVNSPRYPNSIYKVIFQKSQFSPVGNGSIYRTPANSAVIAAKLCLEGTSVVGDCLFFNQKDLSCWASRNATYYTCIGGHNFYTI